jgi:outer membrane protein assembly factor BamB
MKAVAVALCFVAVEVVAVGDEAWPRWRGHDGAAVWPLPSVPREFDTLQPRQLWSISGGKGYGGVTCSEGMVYVADRLTEPTERERVRCLAADSGAVVWQHEWAVEYGKMGGYSTGPRSSVTLQGEGKEKRAFVLGATGRLFCFRAESGEIVWEVDAVSSLGAVVPQWGLAASPVVWDGKLLVHLGAKDGASTLALDPASGAVLWKAGRDAAGYCTPEITTLHGRPHLVQWGPDHVMGIDPVEGRELWTYPYKITYGVSIAQPLIQGDIVLVSGYWHGTKALQLSEDYEPRLLWENEKEICGLMSSPLSKDGLVYLLDKNSGLICFELRSGKILWKDGNSLTPRDRNPHFSSVWMNKDQDLVALLNADGELIYARVSRGGVEELARHQVIAKTWAHPAFAGNKLYARSDSEVVAWELWPESASR